MNLTSTIFPKLGEKPLVYILEIKCHSDSNYFLVSWNLCCRVCWSAI